MRTTIRDIAREAGVSVSAVSLALNDKAGVSEETRKEIRRIARALNYLHGPAEPLEPAVRNGIIEFVKIVKHGRILNENHQSFVADYIEGIAGTSRSLGYDLQIQTFTASDVREVVGALARTSVRGVIVLGTELSEDDFDRFEELATPVLFLDTWHDFARFDFVDMNNFDAVYGIMTYLYERGHTEIGFITGTTATRNLKLRESGYGAMCTRLGLPERRGCLYALDTTYEGAYEDMRKILSGKPELPTALFVGTDIMCYGCMRALKEAGYRIPEDISIVGFDDLPTSRLTEPALTTVSVSKKQMGATAVELLVKRMEREPRMAPVKVLVGGELVVRKSVADHFPANQ